MATLQSVAPVLGFKADAQRWIFGLGRRIAKIRPEHLIFQRYDGLFLVSFKAAQGKLLRFG